MDQVEQKPPDLVDGLALVLETKNPRSFVFKNRDEMTVSEVDAKVIAEAKLGNFEPFGEWFLFNKQRLNNKAAYFLGRWDTDVEDLVQETFAIAMPKIAEFKPEFYHSLYAWTALIIKYLCFERMRKRKRTVSFLEADLEMIMTKMDIDRHNLLTQNMFEDEEKLDLEIIIQAFLYSIDEDSRKLFQMRLEGKSYLEMAKEQRIMLGTVMSKLFRIREKFARFLKMKKAESKKDE